ncbi:MAG: diguanylate cyclase, partial [Methylococcales bacterium]|nr:diguanylate cyclase [Methylococcales bacterium]
MLLKDPDHCKINTEINFEAVFKNIFFDSELGLIVLDSDFHVVNWNPWFSRYCDIEINKVIGKSLVDIFPVLEKSSVQRATRSAIENGMTSVVSHTLNRKPFPLKNGSDQAIQQQILVKPFLLENQQRYCLIQITDVSAAVTREKQLIEQTKRIQAISEKLAQEKERAQVTLNSIADAVITTDQHGNILSMNPVAEMLTGFFENDVQHKNVDQVFKLIHEKTHIPIPCPVKQCLKSLDIVTNDNEHLLIGAIGRFSITDSVAPIFDENGLMLGTVLVFRDVTQSRALTAELNWQALHDPLTGLANRRQFELSMKHLLTKARSDKLKHHLLYLDLDQFKVVNDTCGHDAGDELLKQVTDTLAKKLRKVDLLARLGGDEFGVLLESCDAEDALTVANNLRQAV